jgi:ubiquinone/menaquinone biosynthesis C-methylase UbiE
MSFDALAPHYRWMEFLLAGEKLQRCRTAFLSEARACSNVLIPGEGNGRFLVECRRRLPNARITCVDASVRMLELARRRIERFGLSCNRIEFIQADALIWTAPSQAFDLIVTHFFLDCFRSDQLEGLVAKLSRAATPHASWLIADFDIPVGGLPRRRAQIIHWMMYLFFRCVARLPAQSLTPPGPFLKAHGFNLSRRQIGEWGLLHTDFWTRKR